MLYCKYRNILETFLLKCIFILTNYTSSHHWLLSKIVKINMHKLLIDTKNWIFAQNFMTKTTVLSSYFKQATVEVTAVVIHSGWPEGWSDGEASPAAPLFICITLKCGTEPSFCLPQWICPLNSTVVSS